MRPGIPILLLSAFPGAVEANTLATEMSFSKDVTTQTLSYDGHQSLRARDIRNGLITWNLSASLAKAGSGDTKSSTIGFGAGLGWRNWNWDLTAGLAYSTNSTTNTTTFGPSGTISYRIEFQPPARRKKLKKLRPPPPQRQPVQGQPVQGQPAQGQPAQGQPAERKEIPAEAEFADVPGVEDSSFKPSLLMRGGLRYTKLKQTTTTPANTGPIPLPVPTESSSDLNQLGATAMVVLSPSPSFAIGGGITHFSYTQTSSGGSITEQIAQVAQDYVGSVGAISSLGSLSELSSLGSLGSLGSQSPQLGGSGVQPSDIPVFSSAFTFGALPRNSLDVVLLIFPASWLDIEARGTMTFLTDTDEKSKDVKGTLYFHLSQAWTLGVGAEYAFTSVSKETFVSATLSYAFF